MSEAKTGWHLLLAAQFAWWAAASAVITVMIAFDPDAVLTGHRVVLLGLSWAGVGASWTTLAAGVALRRGHHELALWRAIPRAALAVVLLTPCVMVSLAMLSPLWDLAPHAGATTKDAPGVFALLVLSTLSAWAVSALALAQSWRAQHARALAIEARMRFDRAQLVMLRQQLNPHFMFNALNSIVAVIEEDAERAQTMVLNLAALLRDSLHADQGDDTVARELERVRLYLAVEQARFEDSLDVGIEIEPGIHEAPCLAMLLQPLVENALRHGRAPSPSEPLDVRIRLHRDAEGWIVAEILNSGRWRGDVLGVGLETTRSRLDVAFPPGASSLRVEELALSQVRVEVRWDPTQMRSL